jgi:excisionase family DNA binding protein
MKNFEVIDAEKAYSITRIMNADEVAEMTGFSLPTIQKYTREKLIPHIKIGRSLRFYKHEIIQWLELSRVK